MAVLVVTFKTALTGWQNSEISRSHQSVFAPFISTLDWLSSENERKGNTWIEL